MNVTESLAESRYTISKHDPKPKHEHRLRPARSAPAGLSRLAPVYETLLGIAVIVLIGVYIPGQGWGLLRVQPHPLWIIVLVIAVRYGAFPGALAGSLSAIAYTLVIWSRPEARFQVIALHELIQPFLMFVAGIALGELVEGREQRNADLQARLDATSQALKALREGCQALEKTNVTLEKHIAFEAKSTLTLSGLGQKLQSLNVGDLHGAIVDAMSEFLDVEACSLYVYQHGQLLIQAGLPENWPGRRHILSTQAPLIGQVIDEHRVVTIRDLLAQGIELSLLEKMILMAGPLELSNGRAYGVVAIESVAFDKFTPAMIEIFGMILRWASGAIENALRYEEAEQAPHFTQQIFQRADSDNSRPAWRSGTSLPA